MAHDEREMLELLRFELKFVEDGGYGRSPRTPWRPPYIFEDSPSCPNLGDPARPHPCSECLLMKFVPNALQNEKFPCRFIPLNENGETIDCFYRCGTQLEMEEALAGWLRSQNRRLTVSRVVPIISAISSCVSVNVRCAGSLAFPPLGDQESSSFANFSEGELVSPSVRISSYAA